MNYRKILITCGLTLVSVTSLLAAAPIKSVDQSGNVTYSEKPTADAVSSTEMQIDTGPTQNQIEEAKKRSQQIIDSAEKAQAERDALSAERKKAAEDKAAQTPDVIVIESESGYPAYNRRLGSRPPVATPPIVRPPIARPLPSRR